MGLFPDFCYYSIDLQACPKVQHTINYCNFVVSYEISKSESSKFVCFFFQDYFSCSGSLEYFALYDFSPLKFTETVICPNTLPVLKNVPCTIGKNVYSSAIC